MFRFLSTVSISALLLSSSSAFAGDSLRVRAEVNFRYGQERSITMSEFWLPTLNVNQPVVFYVSSILSY